MEYLLGIILNPFPERAYVLNRVGDIMLRTQTVIGRQDHSTVLESQFEKAGGQLVKDDHN